jgi:hypothetical protein
MSDELKLANENDRGARVETLLKDDLLQEAFNTLKNQYKDEIFKTSITDDEGRKHLWLSYNTIQKVEEHLQEIMLTGKLANEQLNNKNF